MKRLLTLLIVALTTLAVPAQFVCELPEVIAQYPGGNKALGAFLSQNLVYPKVCQEQGVQGRVMVTFVIEKDGRVSEAKVLQSPHKLLSEEAVRVVMAMPTWKPAQVQNKPVRSMMTLPISFRLTDDQLAQCAKNTGAKEDPRGLFRLQRCYADDGRPDVQFGFIQYKYCTDYGTGHIVVRISEKGNYGLEFGTNREGALHYTGDVPVGPEGTDTRIYDSDQQAFKLKWYQDQTDQLPFWPWHTWAIEQYDKQGIEPEVERIIELMEMKYTEESKNPFVGSWRCMGECLKTNLCEAYTAPNPQTYMVMDEKDMITLTDYSGKNSMMGHAVLRPVEYLSKHKGWIEYGERSSVKWVDKDTFRQTITPVGKPAKTLLWKRSGLPKNFQQLLGTNVPIQAQAPSNSLLEGK